MTHLSRVTAGPSTASGRRLLALALGATFLARGVASGVVEGLRAELWLTDQALGTLVSAFAGGFAAALPAGAAAALLPGRRSRLVAAGLACCGGATAAGAAAVGFWSLVAARVAAGAGAGLAAGACCAAVAAAGPAPGGEGAAPGPVRGRGAVALATAGGLGLAYLVGGLSGRWPGWRGAFLVSGAATLALAAIALGSAGPGSPPAPGPKAWSLRSVDGGRRLGPSSARALGALAAAAAAAGALSHWLPAFLERARGLPRLAAGAELGALALLSALAGPALGRALARGGARPAARAVAAGLAAAGLGMLAAIWWRSPLVTVLGVAVAGLGVLAGAGAASSPPAEDWLLPRPALLSALVVGDLCGALSLGALADRVGFGRALFLLPAALLGAAALWAARGRARRTPG